MGNPYIQNIHQSRGRTYPVSYTLRNLSSTAPKVPSFAASDNYSRLHTITDGSFSPDGSAVSRFPVEVTPTGSILQETLAGQQTIGQVDTQGNYHLMNGVTGNMFLDSRLIVHFDQSENPFLKALAATERHRAILGSEIPFIRACLSPHGITGQGVKVGILDSLKTPENNPSTSSTMLSNHTLSVGTIINHPIWGVAPSAQLQSFGVIPSSSNLPIIDNPQLYFRKRLYNTVAAFTDATNAITQAIQSGDPTLKVLSLTECISPIAVTGALYSDLQAKNENGTFKYPQLRQALFGKAIYSTAQDKFQAVGNFVNQLFSTPELMQARMQYIEVTRLAALKGITIVVAAGNDHNNSPLNTKVLPGYEINELTKSPYVISVAACNTNQTPGIRSDDTLYPLSSRGDGHTWNPTITAPGMEIGTDRPYGDIGKNLVVAGTSYATPFVCGVIALMLQKEQNLTFEQIKTRLQQSASSLPGYTVADQGAGVINPEKAILG